MIIKQGRQVFSVTPDNDNEDSFLRKFMGGLITMKMEKRGKRMVFVLKDKYYIHYVHNNSYILLSTFLEEFIYAYVAKFGKKNITIKDIKNYRNKKIELEFISDFEPRDEQQYFIDGMLKTLKHNRVLVMARTGYGKTYMANLVLSKIGFGTLLYLKPTYIPKWIRDLKEYFAIEAGDIYVIKGSKSFCELAHMESKPKFVIISSSTFHNYMEYYTNSLKFNGSIYCIKPDRLMAELNLHTLLTDETHKNFNNIYRAILMLDPKKVIGLTATLITKDKKLSKFHYKLFPKANRLDLLTYRQFIKLENVAYRINTNNKFFVKNMFGYNHKMFEKYILTNNPLRTSYLEMIDHYIKERYTDVKRDGDRMLIFVSSLSMVKLITDHLVLKHPNLDVRPFTGKDEYENALDPDIRISHPQVLAEAVDIKNLIYTLNTVNIDSISTYIQMIGRLRYIKDVDVYFTQLYCRNIMQHYKYINDNRRFISEIVESYNDIAYPKELKY